MRRSTREGRCKPKFSSESQIGNAAIRSAIIYNPESLAAHPRTEFRSMNDFPRFDLQGKTALVTGAARGLGRAISLALAHAGADVAVGLRDVNTGGNLVREIEQLGRKALPLQMDISRLDQISAGIDQAAAHFG